MEMLAALLPHLPLRGRTPCRSPSSAVAPPASLHPPANLQMVPVGQPGPGGWRFDCKAKCEWHIP